LEVATRGITQLTISQLSASNWRPVVGGSFAAIYASNWTAALLPVALIEFPAADLRAPTSDVNATSGLALMTSHSYFFAGWQCRGAGYAQRYIQPVPYLLPINVLEDFSKPLSLSFRLMGNILADELTIAVLATLVPFIVPVPVM
jgi:F-type H+-transporting ATPase subunit a